MRAVLSGAIEGSPALVILIGRGFFAWASPNAGGAVLARAITVDAFRRELNHCRLRS
jgi:hypothetical protein